MAYIVLKSVEKHYDNNHVLKNTNLTIEQGAFVTLLGSSGCGKSTLLRCIAGLETVSSGKIFLDGEDITLKNPRDRKIGMVFQQYSLFPNMTVYNNVAFGLKMKKFKSDDICELVKNTLQMVDLSGYEGRYPYQLSGGEQQRVALARCLVTKPKVLLLDEPLSAIDAKLRRSLQSRIKEIHKELTMTTIFVTHDQDEAMTMSDTIHIMKDGMIEQSGNPFEIYGKPQNLFVASFIGNYNILTKNEFASMTNQPTSAITKDTVIRPESIKISSTNWEISGNDYTMVGHIVDILPQRNVIRYTVAINSIPIKVDVLFDQQQLYKLNQTVYLKVEKQYCISL